MSRYGMLSAGRAAFGGPPRQPSPKESCQQCGKLRVLGRWHIGAPDAIRVCSSCQHKLAELQARRTADVHMGQPSVICDACSLQGKFERAIFRDDSGRDYCYLHAAKTAGTGSLDELRARFSRVGNHGH